MRSESKLLNDSKSRQPLVAYLNNGKLLVSTQKLASPTGNQHTNIQKHFQIYFPSLFSIKIKRRRRKTLTWTMKYSQKLHPGSVLFSLKVLMSSSNLPKFLVKDMRSNVLSLVRKAFQDS